MYGKGNTVRIRSELCTNQSNDSLVSYYYCNRAGSYNPKGKSKRELKSQGSGKIGNQYSVHIKAAENSSSKMVTVKYCSRHYNHACALAFLRLPEKN